MTGLDIDAAKEEKWRRGRIKYGPVFVGHPLEQLDDELIDALNYADEAAKRGYDMGGVSVGLRAICKRVRELLSATGGTGQPSGTTADTASPEKSPASTG
jgi:hypothetical protein